MLQRGIRCTALGAPIVHRQRRGSFAVRTQNRTIASVVAAGHRQVNMLHWSLLNNRSCCNYFNTLRLPYSAFVRDHILMRGACCFQLQWFAFKVLGVVQEILTIACGILFSSSISRSHHLVSIPFSPFEFFETLIFLAMWCNVKHASPLALSLSWRFIYKRLQHMASLLKVFCALFCFSFWIWV